ncbi:hypothetical protein Q8A67_000090 [Cirrhinus molitorella]|uniref:Apolipoprotein L3 n=1 Tax=Cirrhinus molitorella TaxID=172907 RepID=A0AA88U6F7_9TELE|nr:hypothetical protein Q8A67_000090 [Cirrhinus molitorella]
MVKQIQLNKSPLTTTLAQQKSNVAMLTAQELAKLQKLEELLEPCRADVIRLKNEFIKFYERDHPQLQQCIKKLCRILQTFEKDYRGSTEGSKKAGRMGIAGGVALVAGVVAVPFTMGISIVVAAAAGSVATGGAVVLTHASNKSRIYSSQKKDQMAQLRKDIDAELKKFQDKINAMAETMKDLHECTEKILRDFNKLDQQARDLIKTRIRMEDIAELTAHMSRDIRLSARLAAILGQFSLALDIDIISVDENTRAVEDMDKLAQRPIHEEIDEREIKSKAGKFIAEMRALIKQLQNITDGLEKTKDQLADTN